MIRFRPALLSTGLSLLLALPAVSAATLPLVAGIPQVAGLSGQYVEISISGKRLTLFEKGGDGERVPVAEYTVGTALRGLDTYPLGLGKVTGVQFNPWWYPTPYSRQVFRRRGIELPGKVPPGHPDRKSVV